MTKLEPITSEEVLARQVKEQTEAPSVANSQRQGSTNGSTSTTPGALEQPTNSARSAMQTDTKPEIKQEEPRDGFWYRLPIGSYLLSFMYLQFLVAVASGIVLTMILSMQGGQEIGQSLSSVQRETWGALIIAAVFSFFIFSGNNVLRLLTIGGSALLVLLLGYQLVSVHMTFVSRAGSLSSVLASFFSVFIGTYVLAFVLGILLLLATIIYLLRKKVANAYN